MSSKKKSAAKRSAVAVKKDPSFFSTPKFKILVGVVCILLAAALVLTLILTRGSEIDRLERRLERKGFTVVRYGEGAPNPTLQLSVAKGVVSELRATHEGDWIRILQFEEETVATTYCRAWEETYELSPNMIAVRDGCIVYYGLRSVYELID